MTHIIKVPWDSGHRCERMARGPGYLLSNGVLPGRSVEAIEPTIAFTSEIQTAFDLARQISTRVRALQENRQQAIVLSGNCNASIGTIAGLNADETGVLWFDAHGEFNTPETTRSGFLDGMPLTIATGRCWRGMAESIPYFTPLPDQNIILAGVRDTDPEEQAALEASGINLPRGAAAIDSAILQVASRVRHWYIHLDLDVLDPSEATANEWVPAGGLTPDEVGDAVYAAMSLRPVGAAAVASLDPACDSDGRALAFARSILDKIASPG